MRFLQFIKASSSSAEESLDTLKHFSGILDHVIKIVTTLALLVALQVFQQKHSTILVTTMLVLLWVFFFFYLLRLYEHIVFFMLENRTSVDVSSDRVRWVVRLSSLGVNLLLIFWGDKAIGELVSMGFLQD